MPTPLDEYFMAKESGFWSGLRAPFQAESLGRTVGGAALTAGIAAAGAATVPAGKALFGAITKQHDYNQMMENNPDLHDIKSMNPTMFNQMYTSLRGANIRFARDPLVAGAYMRRMGNNPEAAGMILAESMKDNRPQETMSFESKTPGEKDRNVFPSRVTTKG